MIVSYCCDTSVAKGAGAARHVSWARCRSTYEYTEIGRGSSSHVVAETRQMRSKIKESQEKARNLAKGSQIRRQREVVDETGSLPSKQSLPEYLSFLGGMCGRDVVAVADLYSTFFFECLHNHYLGMLRLLNTFLTQCPSSDEISTV